MKKIILFLIICIIAFWVTVFIAPNVSRAIEWVVGLNGITDTLRWGKEAFDGIVTDVPSIDEVVTGYESALSWARDVKNTISDGVTTTKDTIDSIRWWAQKVEETYNNAKETFDSAKETFDDVTGKIEQVQWVVENINNLTNSGSNN